MVNLSKDQIVIKSFSYKETVKRKKTKTKKKVVMLGIEEFQEEVYEDDEVESTHAIIYLIDQNRFWYYNFENDEVIEKHHTKNGLYQSIKIIDDMCHRFETLNEDIEINKYSIFSDPNNEKMLMLIEDYTRIEGR